MLQYSILNAMWELGEFLRIFNIMVACSFKSWPNHLTYHMWNILQRTRQTQHRIFSKEITLLCILINFHLTLRDQTLYTLYLPCQDYLAKNSYITCFTFRPYTCYLYRVDRSFRPGFVMPKYSQGQEKDHICRLRHFYVLEREPFKLYSHINDLLIFITCLFY